MSGLELNPPPSGAKEKRGWMAYKSLFPLPPFHLPKNILPPEIIAKLMPGTEAGFS